MLLHGRVCPREEGPGDGEEDDQQRVSKAAQDCPSAPPLWRYNTYLVAALCSEVWQKRKRTSLRDFVNAYLVAILSVCSSGGGGGVHVAV